MSSEAGHVQISEFNKDVIPSINWMMEDLFCQYGVSIPYFMLDFDFPDYSQRPDWVSGYNFNLDWGEWGYWLPWFNELLGLLWDEAHLPRLTLPDLSPGSWAFFNDYTEILYDNMQRHYVYGQSGTFTKDEVIEGETSGITGWYKWIDGDGYIHVANKKDASGEPVADFEDEKIVGADSGAYGYTYEDYTSWYDFNAGSGAWFFNWQKQPNSWTTYAEAMAKYISEPDPSIQEESPLDYIIIAWYSMKRGIYFEVSANQSYAKFDTSSLTTAQEAKFVIRSSIITVHNVGEYPTIEVYAYDYGDPLTMADWTGGTKVGEKQLTSDDNGEDIEIEIDADSVNLDGYSKYMITSTRIANNNFWPEPPDDDYYNAVVSNNIARLKVKGTK